MLIEQVESFDVDAIKAGADLLELVGADTTLRKVSGKESAGPCPKCGGKDRLHVHTERGLWMCRQCHPEWGDAIEYVQWRDGLTFVEACDLLGGQRETAGQPVERKERPPEPLAPAIVAPADLWQARARAFVQWAQAQLWRNDKALEYLRGRGLSDETIERAGLGYNVRARQDSAERWGLDGKPVYLAAGWVIPCEMGGAIEYVKVRQPKGREPRYLAVRGSTKRGTVYGLDNVTGMAQDLIICEGEINALILAQALGDAAAVVSVGDAGNEPGLQALGTMARCRRWWLAFDPDKAGEHGREKLAQIYARARALSWPWKGRGEKYDLNDAYLDGEDLREWALSQIGPRENQKRGALAAIAKAPAQPQKPAPRAAPEHTPARDIGAELDAVLEAMGGWSWYAKPARGLF